MSAPTEVSPPAIPTATVEPGSRTWIRPTRAPVAVAGWGVAVPETVITNTDLAATLETDDEWITSRTGIRERRVATAGETTGPLAVRAARAALTSAGTQASSVDLVVVATCTAELPMPSTAAIVAAELGITAGGFDLDAACAGFAYGLATVSSMVATGVARRVLLIGADTMSRVVDPTDRATAVLFGDGAAALLLVDPAPAGPHRRAGAADDPDAPHREADGPSTTSVPGLVASDLVADGTGLDLLRISAGGSATPTSLDTLAAGGQFIQMDGRELFRRVVRDVVDSTERVLARAGATAADVTWFAPHQANARIVDAVLARTGIAADRTLGNGARYGNTSAASIPLTLAEAAEAGRLRDGDLVLVSGFGAGLSVASVLWRWGHA